MIDKKKNIEELNKIMEKAFDCKICKKFSKYDWGIREKKICITCQENALAAWYEACAENRELLDYDEFMDAYIATEELGES
ncbi:MAG: hypothetical protein K0R18_419 [Bacillales bacterium]|jgi:transcription elongation factor Elf1|nr:hypothetical protein [Bacillales bacterium]